jgi:hypothetical protein
MLASNAGFRLAGTFDDLLSEEAIALDGVSIPPAARNGVLSEANHLHFRVQAFGVLDCAAQVCRFEVEHLSCLRFLNLPARLTRKILADWLNMCKTYFAI